MLLKSSTPRTKYENDDMKHLSMYENDDKKRLCSNNNNNPKPEKYDNFEY